MSILTVPPEIIRLIAEELVFNRIQRPSSSYYASKSAWTRPDRVYSPETLEPDTASLLSMLLANRQLNEAASPILNDILLSEKDPLLLYAVWAQDQLLSERLLDCGADIETFDMTCRTALHLAATKGDAMIVALLLQRGAQVSAVCNHGNTPLHFSVKHMDVTKQLIAAGADLHAKDTSRRTALHQASSYGTTDVVEYLVDCGADPSARDIRSMTPLQYAILSSKASTVEVLLGKGADISVNDIQVRTPLHLAARLGNERIVDILLQYGAHRTVNEECILGFSALDEATIYGHEVIAKTLIAYGAKHTGPPQRALERAIYAQSEYGVKVYCIHGGASLQAPQPPLLLATHRCGTQIIKFLLDLGADPNVPGVSPYDRDTPMEAAAMLEDLEKLRLLLAAGALVDSDINESSQPMGYWTALDIVAGSANVECVKLLLEHGASVGRAPRVKTPLHSAVEGTISQGFLDGENLLDGNGMDDLGAIEALLQYGADINACDNHGRTVLHLAVQTMGQYGASDELPVKTFEWVLKLLIDAGVDGALMDDDGRTAWDYEWEDSEVMARIREKILMGLELKGTKVLQ